jgi:UDP-N-acetylmuramyl pentapeptide synthase
MPQTLLDLPSEASFCVLELGMSITGEMAKLEAI